MARLQVVDHGWLPFDALGLERIFNTSRLLPLAHSTCFTSMAALITTHSR